MSILASQQHINVLTLSCKHPSQTKILGCGKVVQACCNLNKIAVLNIDATLFPNKHVACNHVQPYFQISMWLAIMCNLISK